VETGKEYLMFHSELGIAVDAESNIIVLDARNHRLIKFDSLGNFVWKSGGKGQGPGEFQNPLQVAVDHPGEIWVLDTGNLIQVFDGKGQYLRTVRLEDRGNHIQFLPENRMLISKTTRGKMGISADFYSKDGKLLNKFPVEHSFGQDLPSWAGGSIGGGGYYFSEKSIHMIIPNVIGPCFMYKSKILINSLMLIEKKAPTDYEIHIFLDIFNEKKQFLGAYKLPEDTWLRTIDSKGNFYFVQQSPYPRVYQALLENDMF